jgi:hypothetical protein
LRISVSIHKHAQQLVTELAEHPGAEDHTQRRAVELGVAQVQG